MKIFYILAVLMMALSIVPSANAREKKVFNGKTIKYQGNEEEGGEDKPREEKPREERHWLSQQRGGRDRGMRGYRYRYLR